MASVIVRNISDIFLWDGLGIGGNTQFFVADLSGKEVKIKQELPHPKTREMFALYRGTQYKFKVPLSEIFALDVPGTYTVSVNKEVGAPRVPTNVIMSGVATIRVVTSKTNNSNTNQAISSASAPSEPSRIVEGPTGQPDGASSELTGTNATTQRNQRMSNVPRDDGQSDASPSRSEAGGTQLGFASGTLRIGASVLLLLVAAALVYLLLRRARRT